MTRKFALLPLLALLAGCPDPGASINSPLTDPRFVVSSACNQISAQIETAAANWQSYSDADWARVMSIAETAHPICSDTAAAPTNAPEMIRALTRELTALAVRNDQ